MSKPMSFSDAENESTILLTEQKRQALLTEFTKMSKTETSYISSDEAAMFLKQQGIFTKNLNDKILKYLYDQTDAIQVSKFIQGYIELEKELKNTYHLMIVSYDKNKKQIEEYQQKLNAYSNERLNHEGINDKSEITIHIKDFKIEDNEHETYYFTMSLDDQQYVSTDKTDVVKFYTNSKKKSVRIELYGIDGNVKTNIGLSEIKLEEIEAQEEYMIELAIPSLSNNNNTTNIMNRDVRDNSSNARSSENGVNAGKVTIMFLFVWNFTLYYNDLMQSQLQKKEKFANLNKITTYLNEIENIKAYKNANILPQIASNDNIRNQLSINNNVNHNVEEPNETHGQFSTVFDTQTKHNKGYNAHQGTNTLSSLQQYGRNQDISNKFTEDKLIATTTINTVGNNKMNVIDYIKKQPTFLYSLVNLLCCMLVSLVKPDYLNAMISLMLCSKDMTHIIPSELLKLTANTTMCKGIIISGIVYDILWLVLCSGSYLDLGQTFCFGVGLVCSLCEIGVKCAVLFK